MDQSILKEQRRTRGWCEGERRDGEAQRDPRSISRLYLELAPRRSNFICRLAESFDSLPFIFIFNRDYYKLLHFEFEDDNDSWRCSKIELTLLEASHW